MFSPPLSFPPPFVLNFRDSKNSSKDQVNSQGALLEGAIWALPNYVAQSIMPVVLVSWRDALTISKPAPAERSMRSGEGGGTAAGGAMQHSTLRGC